MKTIVEILIDNSNSMGKGEGFEESFLLPDGSTRMELVKKILHDHIIPSLNYASRINVKTFHSGKNDKLKSKPIFNRLFDETALKEVINDLAIPNDTGGTPITAAIIESIESLKKYDEYDRKIILLTDGEETGDGDYQIAAEKTLKLHGIPCEIFVVGITQNDKAARKAKDLAKATNGIYVKIKAKTYTNETLSSKFHKFNSQLQIGTLDKYETQLSAQSSLYSNPINQGVTKSSENGQIANLESLQQVKTQIDHIVPENTVEVNQQPIDNLPTHTIGGQPLSLEVSDNDTKQETTKSEELLDEDVVPNQTDEVLSVPEVKQNSKSIEKLMKSVIRLQQEMELIKEVKSKEEKVVRIGRDEEYEEIEDDVSIEENRLLKEKVGYTSERFVDSYLKVNLSGGKIVHKWMNKDGESGESYDFKVLNSDTNYFHYYVECKGTMHSEKVFYLTKKEWSLVVKNPKIYRIYIVTEALSENPKLTIIDNLMTAITRGRVVPYATKHIKLKKERIVFTVLD